MNEWRKGYVLFGVKGWVVISLNDYRQATDARRLRTVLHRTRTATFLCLGTDLSLSLSLSFFSLSLSLFSPFFLFMDG
jgi:hypothetical protein